MREGEAEASGDTKTEPTLGPRVAAPAEGPTAAPTPEPSDSPDTPAEPGAGGDDVLEPEPAAALQAVPDPAEALELLTAELAASESRWLGERAAREAVEARLRDLEGKARAISKAYQEQRDDMVSFRTRMEAQAVQRAERKQAEVVERFFEPVQNLRRSMRTTTDDVASMRLGLQMVLGQFDEALRGLGLEEVPGEGSEFDPTVHEALAVVPVTDPEQDGRVVVVHNTGYRLGARVLQPSQVVIGKYEAPAEA